MGKRFWVKKSQNSAPKTKNKTHHVENCQEFCDLFSGGDVAFACIQNCPNLKSFGCETAQDSVFEYLAENAKELEVRFVFFVHFCFLRLVFVSKYCK